MLYKITYSQRKISSYEMTKLVKEYSPGKSTSIGILYQVGSPEIIFTLSSFKLSLILFSQGDTYPWIPRQNAVKHLLLSASVPYHLHISFFLTALYLCFYLFTQCLSAWWGHIFTTLSFIRVYLTTSSCLILNNSLIFY